MLEFSVFCFSSFVVSHLFFLSELRGCGRRRCGRREGYRGKHCGGHVGLVTIYLCFCTSSARAIVSCTARRGSFNVSTMENTNGRYRVIFTVCGFGFTNVFELGGSCLIGLVSGDFVGCNGFGNVLGLGPIGIYGGSYDQRSSIDEGGTIYAFATTQGAYAFSVASDREWCAIIYSIVGQGLRASATCFCVSRRAHST